MTIAKPISRKIIRIYLIGAILLLAFYGAIFHHSII